MRRLSELMDLSGRRALVTGGAGHIGFAIGQALVEMGATVVVVDIQQDACVRRADELSQHGPGKAFPLTANLLDEQSTRDCVHATHKLVGGIDILVHNAAYVGTTQIPGWGVPFEQQSVSAWDQAIRVNLTAGFILAQEAKPLLAQSEKGSVILVSSIYGMVGPDWSLYADTAMSNPAAYGASKAGVLQLCRYLATVMAPKVRVNTITPGGVARNQPEIFRQRYEQKTPLQRMAVEEDFKGSVAYLASDLSAYVTGHNLVVDGGWTAW